MRYVRVATGSNRDAWLAQPDRPNCWPPRPAASRDADDDLPECAPFTDTSQGGGHLI
jgi:hypothetical protein